MNPTRRAMIRKAARSLKESADYLDDTYYLIDVAYEEESDSLDNMPEQFVNGKKYERAEKIIEALDDFRNHLDVLRDDMCVIRELMEEKILLL